MWKLKLILALGLSTLLLSAWFYVSHLRSENEILTLNNAQITQAVKDLQTYAKELEADQKLKNQQARSRINQIAQLQAQAATLSKNLREVTRYDPKVTECLAVEPGPDFVNQLRQYTESNNDQAVGEGVPGAEPVSGLDP